MKTGFFKSPIFDKSLRDGKGDRLGWSDVRSKVLILEGWFVGCQPVSNLHKIDYIYEDKFNLCLSQDEKDYRSLIQESLIKYSKIWKKFDKIWHLKSSHFNNTILWKTQQEDEMIKIYTTNWCPSCVAAKNLLSELNIDFEEINIEEKGITREKLQKISGQYTVPQIVINDKYIGGYNELMQYFEETTSNYGH